MQTEVRSEIVPTQTGHIRKHKIHSTIDCLAYDSGFAVDARDYLCIESEKGFALAKNKESCCSVLSKDGIAEVKGSVPNTNLISPKTVIPTIKYEIKTGANEFTTEIKEI